MSTESEQTKIKECCLTGHLHSGTPKGKGLHFNSDVNNRLIYRSLRRDCVRRAEHVRYGRCQQQEEFHLYGA